MSHILRDSGLNVPGACHFDYARVQDVESIPDVIDHNIIGTITLKAGATWSRVEVSPPGTHLVEQWNQSGGQQLPTAVMTGFVAKDDLSRLPALWKLKKDRYIIVFTGLSGDQYLLGNLECGAQMRALNRDQGTERSPKRGYNIEVIHSGLDPIPFYNGTPPPPPAAGGTIPVELRRSDSSVILTIPAGVSPYTLPDITHTDSDGSPTPEMAQTSFIATPAVSPSGIAYAFGTRFWSGESLTTTSGQEGDLWDDNWFDYTPPPYPTHYASLAGFTTMNVNNIHGNTNRFTDTTGAQTYANDLVVCHHTGLMWYRIAYTDISWDSALSTALAASIGGYTDWVAPPIRVLNSIQDHSLGDQSTDFAPFNNTSTYLWSATVDPNEPTTKARVAFGTNGAEATILKSGTTGRDLLICRRHLCV